MYIKKHINLFSVMVLILMVFSGCKNNIRTISDIKNRGIITVITNAVFPPFEYYKNNKVEGIDIDISREIAKNLGVKLQILDMNFDGVVAAIASGKGDFVAAGLTIDEKKKKAIDFSNEYISVPQSLVTLKNRNINNVDSLLGKKIGTQIGTTSDRYINNEITYGFLKESGAEAISKKEYLDLVMDLENNRLDVIALDGLIARKLVEKNQNLKFFDRDNEKYALAVKKGNSELLLEINKIIDELINSGKIMNFYNNHVGN